MSIMRVEATRELRETALVARKASARAEDTTQAWRSSQTSVLKSRETNLLATSGRERYESVTLMSSPRKTEEWRDSAFADAQSLAQRQRNMQQGLQRITTAGDTTQDPLRLID